LPTSKGTCAAEDLAFKSWLSTRFLTQDFPIFQRSGNIGNVSVSMRPSSRVQAFFWMVDANFGVELGESINSGTIEAELKNTGNLDA
jgi:hypothetical protein